MNPVKAKRIDLGLTILAAVAKPGQRYSCEEIGAWCDCSAQAIQVIEKKAMVKLRRALVQAKFDEVELGRTER